MYISTFDEYNVRVIFIDSTGISSLTVIEEREICDNFIDNISIDIPKIKYRKPMSREYNLDNK